MITILIILALLTQPLTAHWERPGVARIEHGVGCLWIDDAFYKCYDGKGVLLLGDKGPLDYRYRPVVGSIFTLVKPDGSVEQATIKGVLYFPVFR
jgi:hypothetical protein